MVIAAIIILLLLRYCQREPGVTSATPHAYSGSATLTLGDAVVTGFSGTTASRHAPHGKTPIDQTFINVSGPSVRIFDPRRPVVVWTGRYWAAPHRRDIAAGTLGQVFGIAIDNAAFPNVYFAATSVYGLNLVTPDTDRDTVPERVRKGGRNVEWMRGQFGPGGGPGSIWKLDGRTGQVSLFATITLSGTASGPASLGNLAFDPVHQQLFASDLSTGMIHRFAMNGRDLGHYDHGITGRSAAGLPQVAYDEGSRASIGSDAFDTENPATWGFASAERRVWGVAVQGNADDGVRLYYAVADGTIWSVGLDRVGDFAGDPRREITLPEGAKEPPVSDITFTHDGRMIVAERAVIGSMYDYTPNKRTGVPRVYRFWQELPDDPNTATRWYQQPEEYGVGFPRDSRNSAGGVALGYGYRNVRQPDGTIRTVLDYIACDEAVFFTGDMLRGFRWADNGVYEPDGLLQLHGLQISPAGPARGFNVTPGISYFVNYANAMGTHDRSGTIGDVAVYRVPCKDPSCAVTPATGITSGPPEREPAGPAPQQPTAPSGPSTTTTTTTQTCTPGTPGCGTTTGGCAPGDPNCSPVDECLPGDPNCEPKEACFKADGEVVCDPSSGQWVVKVIPSTTTGLVIDTIRAYSKVPPTSPAISVANGPDIPVTPPAIIVLNGANGGDVVKLDVCGFNGAEAQTGKPYACCRATLTVRIPRGTCQPTAGTPPARANGSAVQ